MVSGSKLFKREGAALLAYGVGVALTLASPAAWCFQGIDDATGYLNATSPLRREGIPLRDQDALIKTLNRRDRPALAASAAFALGRLPKSGPIIRELNFAVAADSEMLMGEAISSLINFGDKQWVPAVTARLRSMKDPFWRLAVAGNLAKVGVYDGWDIIESEIMTGRSSMRFSALGSVDYFRSMKDASGQPIDLIKKLDEMRARSTSPAVRDALLSKITQLTRQPPAPTPPRAKQ